MASDVPMARRAHPGQRLTALGQGSSAAIFALKSAFFEALSRLSGRRLVREALKNTPVPALRVRVMALGKAACSMVWGASDALRNDRVEGIAVSHAKEKLPEGFELFVGAHPIPDSSSADAGRALLQFAQETQPEDFALFLVSGGGSALTCLPKAGLLPDDLASVTEALLNAGLPIDEINAVRSRLTELGAGGLWAACPARQALSLMLSDIPSGNVGALASGPTLVPRDGEALSPALASMAQAGTLPRMPGAAIQYLSTLSAAKNDQKVPEEEGEAVRAEAAKDVPFWTRPRPMRTEGRAVIRHRVLAGPKELAEALCRSLRAGNIQARTACAAFQGPLEELASLVEAAVLDDLDEAARNGMTEVRAVVVTGEAGVKLPEVHGTGGRMQTLCLMLAGRLQGKDAAILCAGSDGRDGPTEWAGAVSDGETIELAGEMGTDILKCLENWDASRAVEALGIGIPRFVSGTNLTDAVVVISGASQLKRRGT